jgi:hypothetical protein
MRKERTAVSVAASSLLTEAKRDANDDCSVRMATDRPPSSCRHIWGGLENCIKSGGGRAEQLQAHLGGFGILH